MFCETGRTEAMTPGKSHLYATNGRLLSDKAQCSMPHCVSKRKLKHQRPEPLTIDYFHLLVLIRSLPPHAIIYGQHRCRIGSSDYLRFKIILSQASFTSMSPGQTARGTVSIPACVVDIRHLIGPTC